MNLLLAIGLSLFIVMTTFVLLVLCVKVNQIIHYINSKDSRGDSERYLR